MSGEIPTPKWQQAPADIRRAWHDHNNVQQRLVAAMEQAQKAIAEMRDLIGQISDPDDKPRH